MLPLTNIVSVLAMAVSVSATLDPATSNTKGGYPGSPGCSPEKTSTDIQAAECAYNTRVHGTQTFAVFKIDHSKDENHGAPYGTCEAYTCTAPTSAQLSNSTDYWTFFWNGNGQSSGVGTGCIRDPNDGTCGCENSDGEFIKGSSSCKRSLPPPPPGFRRVVRA